MIKILKLRAVSSLALGALLCFPSLLVAEHDHGHDHGHEHAKEDHGHKEPSQEAPGEMMKEKAGEVMSEEKITLAGGCFWCMEGPFEKLDGVKTVISGYSGGPEKNPTYEQVSYGKTGHAEVVQVTFDPKKISVDKVLEVFWMNIDPTTVDQQFADRGAHYRSEIFYNSEAQREAAEASKKKIVESGKFEKPIVTAITAFTSFYPAEDYHQDYYKKNPIRYNAYRIGSGRAGYLKKKWGK